MRPGDVNFILSTWLKSYYEAMKFYSSGSIRVPFPWGDVYFQGHQEKIKKLLESASCLVCNAPDEEDQIIGYIVFDEDSLHYCYVKQVYRKMGVAKELRSKIIPRYYSHATTHAKYITKGLEYNPYKF